MEIKTPQQQVNIKPTVSRPPYLLGLLGLIPLVGFFVGVGLILYGALKYKDRKLIFIGIACVLFTIIVYTSLFYIGFRSEFGRKGWAVHAQMELNTLVKHVEFYKLENGKYPESLKQLENDKEFIFLTDPTQSFGTYYNYKNLGEKYLLFSSGVDRIPNTADDIYPQVNTANKKIGWTRAN